MERNNDGEPLGAECFPAQIWGISSAEEKDYRLPELFRAAGYWVVSAGAAEVLRQFDLGSGALYPVAVQKKDNATPVGGAWLCINFGNKKSCFLPDESPRFRYAYIRNGRSEEHTSELQSLMRISYAVFCLKKKKKNKINYNDTIRT